LNDIFDTRNEDLSVIHETGESTGLNGKDRFRLLFERSLEPIIILSGNTIIDCNDAALKVMGASEKTELAGLSVDEISPPPSA
jgi:PAS domain S-box-containing protein